MALAPYFRSFRQPVGPSLALLLARLVAGVAFLHHGWGKVHNPFGWMGSQSHMPAALQALAALSEFGGGLAWILGLLTPLASFGIACTMAVATYTMFDGGAPFVALTGGPSFEMSALLFCIALTLFFAGPGKLSLDRILFGER